MPRATCSQNEHSRKRLMRIGNKPGDLELPVCRVLSPADTKLWVLSRTTSWLIWFERLRTRPDSPNDFPWRPLSAMRHKSTSANHTDSPRSVRILGQAPDGRTARSTKQKGRELK